MLDINDKNKKKIIVLLAVLLLLISVFSVLCVMFLSMATSVISEGKTVNEIGRADIMTIETKNGSPLYFLREHNGIIGVFSEDNVLIEALEVAVITLPQKDREQLRLGITVYGTENLEKIKQDYSD